MAVKSTLLFSVIAEASAGIIDSLCAHKEVNIEVLVYSGTRNPVFTLDEVTWQQVCNAATRHERLAIPTCRALGFTGWKLCPRASGGACDVWRGIPAVDQLLFRAMKTYVPDLNSPVVDHVVAEMARLHDSNGGDQKCDQAEFVVANATAECTAPIRGSDDPSTVHFDPSHDDQGCFVTKQSSNNCYDYANDVVTNSFAQPGRGSGVCPPSKRPCVPNTCEDVKKAAVSDGLTWVGKDLPTALPSDGHYVSLHIWPQSNFHWIRMDANKYWSHKPGGTAVKNHDNKGNLITDPGKADFAPWTEHCGYMLAVPSKGTISDLAMTVDIVV